MNQNSNTTNITGNGSVTNNNLAINIIQAFEEQVSGLNSPFLHIVNALYAGRLSIKYLPVRCYFEYIEMDMSDMPQH